MVPCTCTLSTWEYRQEDWKGKRKGKRKWVRRIGEEGKGKEEEKLLLLFKRLKL